MSKVDKLINEVEKLFQNEKYELYDIEIANEGGKQYLRVFIDSETGIDLEDCILANTILSDYFDEHDPLSDEYILEVSSPGVFRRLRVAKHFEKQIGKKISVKLKSNLEGLDSKKVLDVLTEVSEDYIVVGDIKIPLEKIKKAESTYEF